MLIPRCCSTLEELSLFGKVGMTTGTINAKMAKEGSEKTNAGAFLVRVVCGHFWGT